MHEMHWQKQSKSAIHEAVLVKPVLNLLGDGKGVEMLWQNQYKQNNQPNWQVITSQ